MPFLYIQTKKEEPAKKPHTRRLCRPRNLLLLLEATHPNHISSLSLCWNYFTPECDFSHTSSHLIMSVKMYKHTSHLGLITSSEMCGAFVDYAKLGHNLTMLCCITCISSSVECYVTMTSSHSHHNVLCRVVSSLPSHPIPSHPVIVLINSQNLKSIYC